MAKEAVFTMKLESELRDAFMAAAEAAHRPASQVMRELMRGFIQQQQQTHEYDELVRKKVEAGRASMRAGRGIPNEEVSGSRVRRTSRACQGQRSALKVVWTPEARTHRDAIWQHLAADSADAADRMDMRFGEAAALLSAHPQAGKRGRIRGARELLPHPTYRMVYQIHKDAVWVLGLLHTSRQGPPFDSR